MLCEVGNPYSKVRVRRILCNPEVPVADDQCHKAVFLFVPVFSHHAEISFQAWLPGLTNPINGGHLTENHPDPLYVPISTLFELFQNFPCPKNSLLQNFFPRHFMIIIEKNLPRASMIISDIVTNWPYSNFGNAFSKFFRESK